jgi:uncharacterized protein YjbJ (UPF0337 family)
MGDDDKVSNKAQDLGGRAKEAAGSLTGDDKMREEGRTDQAKAAIKDAGEHLKDAGEHLRAAAGKAGEHLREAAEKAKDATKH